MVRVRHSDGYPGLTEEDVLACLEYAGKQFRSDSGG